MTQNVHQNGNGAQQAADEAARAIAMADAAADFLGGDTTTPPMIQLLKRQICRPKNRQATNEELALFVSVCRRAQLDPFARQICAVFRYDRSLGDEKMSIQTTIDGFRLIANRTREWEGYAGPVLWCDERREWSDVWLKATLPRAARVAVWRKGHREAAAGLAHLEMFRDDRSHMWAPGPKSAHMLAKCAEALAFRRAFPQELSGLYTDDEAGAFDAPPAKAGVSAPAEAPGSLDDAIVEALQKGIEIVGLDDATLTMWLVDLTSGQADVSDLSAALRSLDAARAEALDQRLAALVAERELEAMVEAEAQS